MKAIDLAEIHYLAKHSECEDFIQQIKSKLTGDPETAVIDCNPIVVDANELTKDVQ